MRRSANHSSRQVAAAASVIFVCMWMFCIKLDFLCARVIRNETLSSVCTSGLTFDILVKTEEEISHLLAANGG